MPTYTYETIPTDSNTRQRRFTVKQSIKDAPLEMHPKTGEPVRRVLSGGLHVRLGTIKPRQAGHAPGKCCPECHVK